MYVYVQLGGIRDEQTHFQAPGFRQAVACLEGFRQAVVFKHQGSDILNTMIEQ